jgi:hypothetical protein
MKFITSTYVVLPIEAAVRADPLLGGFWPVRGSDIVLPWPSQAFDRLLQLGLDEGVSLRVSPRLQLDEREADTITLWEMHLDSYCPLSDRDDKWRQREWDQLPYLEGTRNVRRFDFYRISKLRANSKKVTGPGGAFFFPTELIGLLFDSGATSGARWVPITDLAGANVWPTHQLLVLDHMVGPLDCNASMEWMIGPDRYEFLAPRGWVLAMPQRSIDDALDFNLTTDPSAGYNVGSTIISGRVRSIIESATKGAFFTPVLSTESDTYDQFTTLWDQLHAQVAGAGHRLK